MDRRSVLQAIAQVALLGVLPIPSAVAAVEPEKESSGPPEPESETVRAGTHVFRTDDERKLGIYEPDAPTEMGTVYELFWESLEVPHGAMVFQGPFSLVRHYAQARVLQSTPTGDKYIVVSADNQHASWHVTDAAGNVVHLAPYTRFVRMTADDKEVLAVLLDSAVPIHVYF